MIKKDQPEGSLCLKRTDPYDRYVKKTDVEGQWPTYRPFCPNQNSYKGLYVQKEPNCRAITFKGPDSHYVQKGPTQRAIVFIKDRPRVPLCSKRVKGPARKIKSSKKDRREGQFITLRKEQPKGPLRRKGTWRPYVQKGPFIYMPEEPLRRKGTGRPNVKKRPTRRDTTFG
jgi:hypothetical protein